jgi:hypothetical protein
MGRPIGIYLAAFGTLAWIAVGLVRWKLRDPISVRSPRR